MKVGYYDLELHFILLDDPSQSYILKLRDRLVAPLVSSSISFVVRGLH